MLFFFFWLPGNYVPTPLISLIPRDFLLEHGDSDPFLYISNVKLEKLLFVHWNFHPGTLDSFFFCT